MNLRTAIASLEKEAADHLREYERLRDAIEVLKAHDRPRQVTRLQKLVNGALSAHAARATAVTKAPPLFHAVADVIATGPQPMEAIYQALQALGPAAPKQAVTMTLVQAMKNGRATSTAKGWKLTAKGRRERERRLAAPASAPEA